MSKVLCVRVLGDQWLKDDHFLYFDRLTQTSHHLISKNNQSTNESYINKKQIKCLIGYESTINQFK